MASNIQSFVGILTQFYNGIQRSDLQKILLVLTYKYTMPEKEYKRSAQNTTNMECRNF